MSRTGRRKILGRTALVRALETQRRRGRRIVFTNGCFDILHAGHVSYLARARSLGDLLVVGLNADASVRRLKGPGRPVNSGPDRARVLAALECVDYVTFFAENTPERLIRSVKPHCLVKGGDWKKKNIVGAAFVEAGGGRVRTLPFLKGRSTSAVLARIERLG